MLATTVLDHLGQAAAMLLLLYLLIVLIIFLAFTGGLAFGLWWVNRKSSTLFGKANSYIPKVQEIVRRGTDWAALPFVKAGGLVATVTGTAESLRSQTRRRQDASPSPGDDQLPQSMPPV